MTEKEKMLAYMFHNTDDAEIDGEKTAAHDMCADFNNTPPSDVGRRTEILAALLPDRKGSVSIKAPFTCELGYNIHFGDGFRADEDCLLINNGEITFGENVTLGAGCIITTPVHPLTPEKRNTWKIFALPIVIGDNTVLGAKVKVLAGVTIGSDCVVESGSVVTKDIPSGSIAAGNPCRVIGKRVHRSN